MLSAERMSETTCTKDKPNRDARVHPDGKEVPDSQSDGWPAGDTIIVECPNCGRRWIEELPQ
jgi:hypothetical protein